MGKENRGLEEPIWGRNPNKLAISPKSSRTSSMIWAAMSVSSSMGRSRTTCCHWPISESTWDCHDQQM
eukprot:1839066-Karenia_brevis.AAC.1